MDLKEIGWEEVDRMHPVEYKN